MRKTLIRIAVLCLILALCLLPVTAYAAADGEEPDAAPVLGTPEPPAKTVDAVTVGPMDEFFAPEGSVVYNNAGVVYNNGGTVYNNRGTVYCNSGVVYNNAGVVYGNGGTVYNNQGTVYGSGARVLLPDGAEAGALLPEEEDGEALPADAARLLTDGDYSLFVAFEGMSPDEEPGLYRLEPEAEYLVRAKEGYAIVLAELQGGALEEQADGAFTLLPEGTELSLRLSIQVQAPVISLASGTYGQEQLVELSAAEGAFLYCTTDGSEPSVESGRYTGPIPVREGMILRAFAAAEGAEPSELAEAVYAVVKAEAPVFETATEGYFLRPEARPITVEVLGTQEAEIERVRISGPDARCFLLNNVLGAVLPAGSTDDSSWTVQPGLGLPAGEYSAVVTLTLRGGQELELPVRFTVQRLGN